MTLLVVCADSRIVKDFLLKFENPMTEETISLGVTYFSFIILTCMRVGILQGMEETEPKLGREVGVGESSESFENWVYDGGLIFR